MTGFNVRPAEPQDSKQLEAIMLEYITDFYLCPAPPKGQLRELVRTLNEKQVGVQFVAEAAGALAGFVTLYFSYSTLRAKRTVIMNDLYVLELFRGTGVAKGLFEAALSYTRDGGFASMNWETAKDNFRAQRFYAKMGGIRGEWLNYSIQ